MREVVNELREAKGTCSRSDPNFVRKQIALAKTLYMARLISREEYVFYAVYPVENLFNDRLTKDYDIIRINKAIEEIKIQYRLKPDEYWAVGDGPPEYKQLNTEYEDTSDRIFLKTLYEFELGEFANLIEENPEEFDRLRERGRRAIFHGDELPSALSDIVVHYEEDAKRAAAAEAYSAAIVSLGAGLEGLLLLRCLRSKCKASRIARNLKRGKQPRYPEDILTWTFDNLIQVCFTAKWLPSVSTSYAKYSSAGLADLLRKMRNYVHPGRYAKEKPWCEISKRDYNDAYAIYIILLSEVGGIGSRKLKSIYKIAR